MTDFLSKIKINNRDIEILVSADSISPGDDVVLYTRDKPPSFESTWADVGYSVDTFLSDEDNMAIKNMVLNGLKKEVSSLGIDTTNFTLDKYHEFVDDIQHLDVVEKIRAGGDGTGGLLLDGFCIPIERVEERISQICNTKVTTRKTFDLGNGKSFTTKTFWVRIVRPQKYQDNNPPHRDVHLDRGGTEGPKAINIYYPLAGSNENSALPVIPGSHLWSEKDTTRTFGNVYVNNVKFTNPAIVDSTHGLNLITPNPGSNQVMVFTPYLVHGGGFNFNTDVTRISLEMRFWRV